jgi:hypothetical protein
MRVYLDVDIKEKDEAKRDGAHWDPAARKWYVDNEPEALDRVRPWWPLCARDWPGPMAPVSLIGVPTIAIAGVVHEGRFHSFDDLAVVIATLPDLETVRAECMMGELKRRWSRTLGRRSVANGCFHCDALLGNHPLRAALDEMRAAGTPWSSLTLATVMFPAAELRLAWYD